MSSTLFSSAFAVATFLFVAPDDAAGQASEQSDRFKVVRSDGHTLIVRSADGPIARPEDLPEDVIQALRTAATTRSAAPARVTAAYVVTDASDAPDADLTDNVFAPATLRAAIQNANKSGVAASISFASGLTTIAPASNLPSFTVAVTIDGSVAAGKVILDGTAVASGIGLFIKSSSTVQNISFQHWSSIGLALGSGTTNNTVKRCEFKSNQTGVNVNSSNSTIGGPDPADGNTAGLNTQQGISLVFTTDIIVQNNLVGTFDGVTASPNTYDGLYVLGTRTKVLHNVASGNSSAGISIGEYSTGTLVRDNIIGLDSSGHTRLGNGNYGINVFGDQDSILSNVISGNGTGISVNYQASDVLIQGNIIGPNKSLDSLFANYTGISLVGTPVRVDSNIISGNTNYALNMNGYGGAVLTRNKIGTDPTGTIAWPNMGGGINLGSDNNIIGGPSPGDGNLISGNQWGGIEMYGGMSFVIGGPTPYVPNWVQGNVIQNNKIGTDITGTLSLSNFTGVFMNGYVDSNFVRDNLISGNRNHGVWTRSSPTAPSRNIFTHNLIGTQANGVDPLPNDSCGVMIDAAANNVFGGLNDGDGNIIAHSNQAGIAVKAGAGTRFQRNSIFHNKGLGIDLGNDGPTPNDSAEAHVGANGLQNFPRITWIHNDGSSTTVKGHLRSRPNTTFRLEFYTNDEADSTGFGEGQTFQTSVDVVTDSAGIAPFEVTISGAFGRVVGTATDPDYGTSEFSKAPFVVNSTADRPDANPNDGLASTSGPQVNGAPEVTLRSALTASNHVLGEDDIVFDIPGGGTQFILPQSQLPLALDDVTINGTTQPGFTQGAPQVIQVLGSNAGASAHGLRLSGSRSTVRGIYLSGFTANGIDAPGDLLILGDVTTNNNKGHGVRAAKDVTLDGEGIFSGNGPAAPSSASCDGQSGSGVQLAGWFRGKGTITASGNCGAGIHQTADGYNSGLDLDASVTASNNGGGGIWSYNDILLRGEQFVFNSNGSPTKPACGVRAGLGDIVIQATGAGPGANITANSNSSDGFHSDNGSITLRGRAQANNNGAGLTVVQAFNRKVTGIWAERDITTDDVEVKANGLDGIKAGNSIVIDGNSVASDHPGRGIWGVVNITLNGDTHVVENNLDGGIWAANGFLNAKGTLTARNNTVGGHHGEEESPDRTDVLVGSVEAYKFIIANNIVIENNTPTGISSWGSLLIDGNAVVKNNKLRGIYAHERIVIGGAQHEVSGNGGDGISTNNGELTVRGHIVIDGNGGTEGEGFGAWANRITLENVTARGNVKDGLASTGDVIITGTGIVLDNQVDGIDAAGVAAIAGGRVCNNVGYGIRASIIRMSGTQVCSNGKGGVKGQVQGAPGSANESEAFRRAAAEGARRTTALMGGAGSLRTTTAPALASSIIRGGAITDNAGIGVETATAYPFRLEGSNISGNSGLAVSASGGGSVTADGNWWGSPDGPGAGISGPVTAASWLSSAVGVYVGVGVDSVYVLPGDSGTLGVVAVNWSAVTDSFTVDGSDSKGWLTPVAGRMVAMADSTPAVTPMAYVIPGGAAPGDTSRIIVSGGSQVMPGTTGGDTLYFVVYTPVLHEIAILADTVVAAPGDTVRLAAAGFDQTGRAAAFAATWTATGGTIDSTGEYHAGAETGVFVVHLADTLAGLSDSAYVKVILPAGPVPGTISISAATLDAGNVQTGTLSVVPFSITNAAGGILRIDSMKTLSSDWAPAWDPTINQLRPGDTLTIGVTFSPVEAGGSVDTLYIYNSSPVSPAKVALNGNGSVTGVAEAGLVPTVYSLDQNYPNPFNPSTTIRYGLPVASRVRLTIHDILGREIARLDEGVRNEGYATVVWAPRVASGVYFLRIDATAVSDPSRRFVRVRRMALIK